MQDQLEKTSPAVPEDTARMLEAYDALDKGELVVKASTLKRALAVTAWFDLYSAHVRVALSTLASRQPVGRISTFEKALDSFPKEK